MRIDLSQKQVNFTNKTSLYHFFLNLNLIFMLYSFLWKFVYSYSYLYRYKSITYFTYLSPTILHNILIIKIYALITLLLFEMANIL